MDEDEIRIYKCEEMTFDAKLMKSGHIEVFIRTEDDNDCLDDGQVEWLPSYLQNASENEWHVNKRADKVTVEQIISDMTDRGYTHTPGDIDWDH